MRDDVLGTIGVPPFAIPLHVLHVWDDETPQQARRQAARMALAQAGAGWRISVAAPDAGEPEPVERYDWADAEGLATLTEELIRMWWSRTVRPAACSPVGRCGIVTSSCASALRAAVTSLLRPWRSSARAGGATPWWFPTRGPVTGSAAAVSGFPSSSWSPAHRGPRSSGLR